MSALPPLLPLAGPLALGEHVTESLVSSAMTLSLTGAPVLRAELCTFVATSGMVGVSLGRGCGDPLRSHRGGLLLSAVRGGLRVNLSP